MNPIWLKTKIVLLYNSFFIQRYIYFYLKYESRSWRKRRLGQSQQSAKYNLSFPIRNLGNDLILSPERVNGVSNFWKVILYALSSSEARICATQWWPKRYFTVVWTAVWNLCRFQWEDVFSFRSNCFVQFGHLIICTAPEFVIVGLYAIIICNTIHKVIR